MIETIIDLVKDVAGFIFAVGVSIALGIYILRSVLKISLQWSWRETLAIILFLWTSFSALEEAQKTTDKFLFNRISIENARDDIVDSIRSSEARIITSHENIKKLLAQYQESVKDAQKMSIDRQNAIIQLADKTDSLDEHLQHKFSIISARFTYVDSQLHDIIFEGQPK